MMKKLIVLWFISISSMMNAQVTDGNNYKLTDIVQQAKEMHREEIERAVIYGMAESVRERYSDKKLRLKPKGEEQKYYNETYNQ